MPAYWDGADDVAKILNWIAPLANIGLAFLWLIAIPAYAGPTDPFSNLFNFGQSRVTGIIIGYMIVQILSGVIYFIPKLGPFQGVKDDDIYVWPEHIMLIVCASMASFTSWYWIGGGIMWLQFLMVSILGSNPIWEADKQRA